MIKVDYSVVFIDSVTHCNLWFKLYKLGINGKLVRIIQYIYIYNSVKTCVKGCNSLIDYFKCVVGLKQAGSTPLF